MNYDKAAKERERAWQEGAAERDRQRVAAEKACGDDGGHVYDEYGRCAGCRAYSRPHDRSRL